MSEQLGAGDKMGNVLHKQRMSKLSEMLHWRLHVNHQT